MTVGRSDPSTGSREAYDKELCAFEEVVDALMAVSAAQGGIVTSARYLQATKIYTRLTITGITFLRLLPGNPITRDILPEHWDWPSVASIARNIVEAYLLFHYVGLEAISDEEVDFRRQLLRYHHNCEKYRLYKAWSAGPEVLVDFETRLPAARAELEAHPVFARLTNAQQRRVCEGRSASYLLRDQMVGRLTFDAAELRPFYRFFSSQVHTSPFSFEPTSNERGRGEENAAERGYITFASQIARKYLAASVLGMAKIFPTVIGEGRRPHVRRAQHHFDELVTKPTDV